MSARMRLEALLARARMRRGTVAALIALPPLAVVLAATWRLAPSPAALAAVTVAGLALAVLAVAASLRGLDRTWLCRQLDARCPDFEDSSALLFAPSESLTGLAVLQRARLETRAGALTLPDLRPPWPGRRLAALWAIAALALALALWLPAARGPQPVTGAATRGAAAEPAATALAAVRLEIAPPAYTGLPPRSETGLDVRVPEGATLTWRLDFTPGPATAELRFHDGEALSLVPGPDGWSAQRQIDSPRLYRLHVEGAPALEESADRAFRIEVEPDRSPRLEVSAPERTLDLVRPGQRAWTVEFEASDDYGLGPARLALTHAHGSGENVTFRESVRTLSGEGDATRRRYRHRIALTGIGFEPGDDLVLRLSVADNRVPEAQVTTHPSFILRWPLPEGGAGSAVEGLVGEAMPAYFRSQRQIIIDTEALVTERERLDAERFVARSDAIGVDQRILRLRYGQFLGEEAEGDERPAGLDDEDADHADLGHDAMAAVPKRFGEAGDVLAEYGHTHDHAEAATLFDPRTRALLKSALDAMWRSEEQLRTGQPRAALPHQYRALDFIKQVQQAGRIYLARVGLELPPIDFDRRLSGDLSGVRSRPDPLAPAAGERDWLAASWRALDGDGDPDLDRLAAWLEESPPALEDPLALPAALDAVRRDPGCADCRERLRARLWPLLPVPGAAVRARPAPDAAGGIYLDALALPDEGERP